MNDGYIIKNGEFGARAILTSPWSNSMFESFGTNRILELELNVANGWRGRDISFLDDLAYLRVFEIFDFGIRDISPIHSLRNLGKLGISTYCNTGINFAVFSKLRDCAIEWRPGASSVFQCFQLKKLLINNYKGLEFNAFSQLMNLTSLSVLSAPFPDLGGISALKELRFLRLANLRNLRSLDGIEKLINIEELKINTCKKIGSLPKLSNLKKLRKLHLDNVGNIASLKPLNDLDSLESFTFVESTNILDGDLTPLLNQEHLMTLAFKNRSHYTHKRESFPAFNKNQIASQ